MGCISVRRLPTPERQETTLPVPSLASCLRSLKQGLTSRPLDTQGTILRLCASEFTPPPALFYSYSFNSK